MADKKPKPTPIKKKPGVEPLTREQQASITMLTALNSIASNIINLGKDQKAIIAYSKQTVEYTKQISSLSKESIELQKESLEIEKKSLEQDKYTVQRIDRQTLFLKSLLRNFVEFADKADQMQDIELARLSEAKAESVAPTNSIPVDKSKPEEDKKDSFDFGKLAGAITLGLTGLFGGGALTGVVTGAVVAGLRTLGLAGLAATIAGLTGLVSKLLPSKIFDIPTPGPKPAPLTPKPGSPQQVPNNQQAPKPEAKPPTPANSNTKPAPRTRVPNVELKKPAEEVSKTLAEQIGKTTGKDAAKVGGKAVGKSLLKKVPIVGAVAGAVFAADRALSGDFTGAGMELASGVASIVPGYGTAVSVGIDAAIAGRDMVNANTTEPDTSGAYQQNESNSVKLDGKEGMAKLIYTRFRQAGFSDAQARAAVANSIRESSLNPNAIGKEESGSKSVGLFQLNDAPRALGAGMSIEERQDPEKNIAVAIEAAKKSTKFNQAQTVDEAIDAFVRYVERPKDKEKEIEIRQQIAKTPMMLPAESTAAEIIASESAETKAASMTPTTKAPAAPVIVNNVTNNSGKKVDVPNFPVAATNPDRSNEAVNLSRLGLAI